METNLLDRMLNVYQAEQTTVTITLQNKIRVSGKIKAFDSYIVVMDGQKRGLVYRHAISSVAVHSPEKQQQPEQAVKPAPVHATPKPSKPATQKSRPRPAQPALAASSGEPGLNNSMKEGLLKWMQEQKAAK